LPGARPHAAAQPSMIEDRGHAARESSSASLTARTAWYAETAPQARLPFRNPLATRFQKVTRKSVLPAIRETGGSSQKLDGIHVSVRPAGRSRSASRIRRIPTTVHVRQTSAKTKIRPMAATRLSLRRLWLIYKRTSLLARMGGRELATTQLAFYSGARGVLKVLAHLIEQGDYEELHETIRRQGRRLDKIQGRRLRARRH